MPASKIIFNIGVLATAMGRRAKAGREQGDIMMLEKAKRYPSSERATLTML